MIPKAAVIKFIVTFSNQEHDHTKQNMRRLHTAKIEIQTLTLS